ncbi:hypothetical protein E4K65_03530 [Bradyrhizobium niftali]|uniref:Uncharacterized protein n=1 Tax=Bradyrhizobium niftali TaxID=2560055 RepID=A0A4Y9M847_9BRAD|nr:hypothetical protein E4K65_03530 [Bradyrhizobium niftali]
MPQPEALLSKTYAHIGRDWISVDLSVHTWPPNQLKRFDFRSNPSWAPHKNNSLAISTTYLIILIETFRRRKDGEDWARDMERNIDRRGSPKPKAAAPVRTGRPPSPPEGEPGAPAGAAS